MFAAMRVIDTLHLRTAASKFPVGNPQSSRAGRATLHTEAIRGDEEIGKTSNGGHLDTRVDQNADLGRLRLSVGFASNSVGFTHSFGAWFGVKSKVSADHSRIASSTPAGHDRRLIVVFFARLTAPSARWLDCQEA
jgi:hypothetical protein